MDLREESHKSRSDSSSSNSSTDDLLKGTPSIWSTMEVYSESEDIYISYMYKLAAGSWPTFLNLVGQHSIELLNIIVVGQSESVEMQGALGIGMMWYVVTSQSVLMGFASTLETLCSQAFGAGNMYLVGEHMNRARVIASCLCLPLLCILAYTREIMLILGQKAEIAEGAQHFAWGMLPGLLFHAHTKILERYQQAQRIFKLPMLFSWVVLLFYIPLLWVLLRVFKMGVFGIGLALSARNISTLILNIFYLSYTKCCGDAWFLPTLNSLEEWHGFAKVAVPSTLLLILEFWGMELLNIESGYFSLTHIAATVSLLTMFNFLFSIPWSISLSASSYIGSFIGGHQTEQAKTMAKNCIVFNILIIGPVLVLFHSFHGELAFILSFSEEVREIIISVFPIGIIAFGLDNLAVVMSGILKGIKLQDKASVISIISNGTHIWFLIWVRGRRAFIRIYAWQWSSCLWVCYSLAYC